MENLNINEVKEALADRFRCINLDNPVSAIESRLNEYGAEGFAIQYLTDKMIIMVRVVRLNDVQLDGAGKDFTFQVPGAEGSA